MTRGIWTIPNGLTLLRLGLLPVVVLLVRAGRSELAAGVFMLAMVTDAVDGWLARLLNQRSRLGVYLDAVVDKVILLTMFYELGLSQTLPMAVAHLLLARELLVSGVRSAAASGGAVVGANWMGKVKAAWQTLLIFWGLLMPAVSAVIPHGRWVMVQTALVVCAWTLVAVAWLFLLRFVYLNLALLAERKGED
jgi:CDP-diacylglycerol--glycerol-3-phosphate 3-phosphatidyltransferase